MLNTNELKIKLDKNPKLCEFLFKRGFLISDTDIPNLDKFPFYGNWRKEKHGEYWYMAHNSTSMSIYTTEDEKVFFLMGHAYNPCTMEHDEYKVLERIAQKYGTDSYVDCLNEITGIFVMGVVYGKNIEFHVDASGMQSACYANVNDSFFISSHPQLIGDICDLTMDDFIKISSIYSKYKKNPIICLGRSPKWFLNAAFWMKDGIPEYKFVAFSKYWFYPSPKGMQPLPKEAPTPEEEAAYRKYLDRVGANPKEIVNTMKETGKKTVITDYICTGKGACSFLDVMARYADDLGVLEYIVIHVVKFLFNILSIWF